MAMTVTGIHHACVVVTDPAKARAFYAGVLGMEEVPMPAAWDSLVLWFRFGDYMVHLLPRDTADPIGPRHFALHVEDINAAREHVKQHGCQIDEAPVIPGSDRFYTSDPFGNRIEFIQWFEEYVPGS